MNDQHIEPEVKSNETKGKPIMFCLGRMGTL